MVISAYFAYVATKRQLLSNCCTYTKASTLVHVSGLIARLMQCHVSFLVMWRRESEMRKEYRCFTRQPPHKLNFRTMRQLDHHRTSFCCHATYNIPFLFTQIKKLKSFYGTIYLSNKSSQNYVSCMRLPIRRHIKSRNWQRPYLFPFV